MNAPPSTLRLALSAPVAALALVLGFYSVPAFVPPGEFYAAFSRCTSLALLLAWLLAPAPWGGGATLGALLTPDWAGPMSVLLAVTVPGTAMAGIVATFLADFGTWFDLDRIVQRPATTQELAGSLAQNLGFAAFHALYILGWVFGPHLRAERNRRGLLIACGLTVAYQTLTSAAAGDAESGFALGLLVSCPLTLLMAVPVLLGGRVWPVILAAAAVMTLPTLVVGVTEYRM